MSINLGGYRPCPVCTRMLTDQPLCIYCRETAYLQKEVERLTLALRRIATMECHSEGSLPVTPSELREISRDALSGREPKP